MAFDVLNCMGADDKGKPFLVVLNEIPARIHIERVYEYRYKDEGFNMAPFSKIEEDRGGMLSHSRVQIWFDSQTFDAVNIKREELLFSSDQFTDISIEYLNKFIKTYRLVTGEYWLRPVIRKDIFNMQYILVDDNNQQNVISIMIPKHHVVKFNGGEEFELNQITDSTLRHILQSDEYDFERDYFLSVQDNFSLGYFNIALVNAVTLFESFVYSQLKKTLSKTKLKKIKKKDCGCLVGISEVCERGISEYYQVEFGETKEYQNLKEKALKHRNLIVHGEQLENVGEKTCDEAINAVIAARAFLIPVFSG